MNGKQAAGELAVKYIQDGMNVGLGTGSTVYWTILKLGERVREGLQVRAVPTSVRTEELAREQGIPLIQFADLARPLDLTIDGADEVNPQLSLIKGGGGALLREKLVAAYSERFIVVADDTKEVAALGRFPLPVEVVPFGWEITSRRLAALGCEPILRRSDRDGTTYHTDNGNYILDCRFGTISDPGSLGRELNALPGVVEHGLFVGMAERCLLGGENGSVREIVIR
ncbi:ribose-5-phosphate isomerase RpiA [Paenibacillus gansuensis]|uniref:Ribose-5-phosphate isomerase A n=1 Tax=Paenibacillus gansuensis TaxID=306542 RepID=A0ABW5P9L0_9BACL